MTEVNTNNSARIQNHQALYARFNNKAINTHTIGVEGEFFLMERDMKTYISPALLEKLQNQAAQDGISCTTEAAGVLEYCSKVYNVSDFNTLADDAFIAEAYMQALARENDLYLLKSAVPPFTTLDEALTKMRPRQRIVDMTETVREALPLDALRIGYMSASTQVSITYKDPHDLYRMLHRGYALMPLLLSLFASDCGLIEGKRTQNHVRSALYNAYDCYEGGLPSYLQKAHNPESLIAAHVDAALNAPMLYYYDEKGGMHKTFGKSLTKSFNDLARIGLNTEANFSLAESFLYHDIKFKPLPNDLGYRLEFRAIDSAPGSMAAASALISMLLLDEYAGGAYDALLKEFGFKGDFPSDYALLKASRENAAASPGGLDEASFGNGCLRDFATKALKLASQKLKAGDPAASALRLFMADDYQPLTKRYRAMDDRALLSHLVKA